MAIATIPDAETVFVAEGAPAGLGSTGALLLELAGTGIAILGLLAQLPAPQPRRPPVTRSGTPGTQ